jgi:soluble lytic murein transglycosylase-like protein/outer membrane protein assembly factor BamD (BamD/ComL family)
MSIIISLLLLLNSADKVAVARPTIDTSESYAIFIRQPITQLLDDDLVLTRRLDSESRGPDGKITQLSVAEHLRRANVYMSNRAFAEARVHWQSLLDRYPTDPAVSMALYGMGRSHFQERGYEWSLPYFERLTLEFKQTKDGREGLYSLASALLRMGRADEAAARYREYTQTYPQGERIDAAYLNVIDTFREAGRQQDAITWIDRTRKMFPGMTTDTNALFARLRLDIAGNDWTHAIATADDLRRMTLQRGVMTSLDELAYLRAYCLEKVGRTQDAINGYLMLPERADSYHGWLATERLLAIKESAKRPDVVARMARANAEISRAASQYPAPYREVLVRAAAKRKLDPRLLLAIMRQESSFRERAKSPAAARGLLQLVVDTASKYAKRAGVNNLQEDDLYRPAVSINIGSEYLAELFQLFPNLPEAVVASYNGGEDNVARWVKRTGRSDGAIVASEVGFAETKTYVFKVMTNYRAYQQLYTSDLRRK